MYSTATRCLVAASLLLGSVGCAGSAEVFTHMFDKVVETGGQVAMVYAATQGNRSGANPSSSPSGQQAFVEIEATGEVACADAKAANETQEANASGSSRKTKNPLKRTSRRTRKSESNEDDGDGDRGRSVASSDASDSNRFAIRATFSSHGRGR